MKTRLFLFVLTLALVIPCHIMAVERTWQVTGIYSNMYFNEEGGDLLGMEIFIFLGDKYYALVQQSEGEPSKPLLLPLTLIGNDDVLINYPFGGNISKITGTIHKDKLVIQSHYSSHTTAPIILKRGKSYWQ